MSASATDLPTTRRISPGEFFAQYGIVLVVLVVSMTILSPILREGQQLFLTHAT
jgi:hypothetical protein